MPTAIHITRRTPFTKSDTLREDLTLHDEAQALSAWLAERDISTVTMAQVLAHARAAHADAVLARDPVYYEWVYLPEAQMWVLKCYDRGSISYVPAGDSDPILIRIEISAAY